MSNCCDSGCESGRSEKSEPRRYACPQNANEYIEVAIKTIWQQINSPWHTDWVERLSDTNYYFCDDPDCDVVYFGLNGAVINKSELRVKVGVKEQDDLESPICYCFGVTKGDALQNPGIKSFVTQQTREKHCACEIRNPSGRCCLKDFPSK